MRIQYGKKEVGLIKAISRLLITNKFEADSKIRYDKYEI